MSEKKSGDSGVSGVAIVSFNFQGMLAALLDDTRAQAWKETDGPDSGCGVDYWYHHWRYGDVYINLDQDYIKIVLCEADEMLFEGNPAEDEELKQFVNTQ